MMEPEIIQRFLESVGQKADVELYLKLFRAQRKESFAILAAGAQIVKSALDPVHFDLRILTGLGLVPSVVVGLFEPKDADRQAQRVQEWLVEDAVPARIVATGAELAGEGVEAVRTAIGAGEIPLVTLEGASEASNRKRPSTVSSLWGSSESSGIAPRASVTRMAAIVSGAMSAPSCTQAITSHGTASSTSQSETRVAWVLASLGSWMPSRTTG